MRTKPSGRVVSLSLSLSFWPASQRFVADLCTDGPMSWTTVIATIWCRSRVTARDPRVGTCGGEVEWMQSPSCAHLQS